jgi:hypothetical protein
MGLDATLNYSEPKCDCSECPHEVNLAVRRIIDFRKDWILQKWIADNCAGGIDINCLTIPLSEENISDYLDFLGTRPECKKDEDCNDHWFEASKRVFSDALSKAQEGYRISYWSWY